MKSLIIYLSLLLPSLSFAGTRANFFGPTGMVQLVTKMGGFVLDDDAAHLYASMNVPPQSSPMGPGKGIQVPGNALSITCALRGDDPLCTMIIKASAPGATVSPAKQLISYEANGAFAAELHAKFVENAPGLFEYHDSDGMFLIQSTPEHFFLKYQN